MQRTIEICLAAAFISAANALSVLQDTDEELDRQYRSCIAGAKHTVRMQESACREREFTAEDRAFIDYCDEAYNDPYMKDWCGPFKLEIYIKCVDGK